MLAMDHQQHKMGAKKETKINVNLFFFLFTSNSQTVIISSSLYTTVLNHLFLFTNNRPSYDKGS